MQPIGLLTFHPILKSKVWGGRRLAGLGKQLLQDGLVGESWEIADLAGTAAEGGGGGAARSMVAAGAHAGMTLAELIARDRQGLLGDLPAGGGSFPLLVKYLDAAQNLSVQVHPDAAYCKQHPQAHLKTESWYVVEALPGAVVYAGVREDIDHAGLAAAVRAGACEELLVQVPVQSGDFVHLPSGTVHALGAGVLVAEVQTPSDTTFRLHDWGRQGRTLHVEAALQCARLGARGHIEVIHENPGEDAVELASSKHYRIVRRQLARGGEASLAGDGRPRVLMCVKGAAVLASEDQQIKMPAGATVLAPACCAKITMRSNDQEAAILEVTFPRGR